MRQLLKPKGGSNRLTSDTDLPDEDSVAAQLVTELDEGEASEHAIRALREGLKLTSPQNVEVRLRHLQTQVSDLTAYIDALEEFLDERGSAIHVLQAVESDLETLRTEIEKIERRHKTNYSNLGNRLTGVEETVTSNASLQQDLSGLQEHVNSLHDQQKATHERAITAADRIDRLEKEVQKALNSFEQRQRSLQQELQAIKQTHDQLAEAFEKPSTAETDQS